MREGAKRRLTGTTVLVVLAVIFIPMLFEEKSSMPPENHGVIPAAPNFPEASMSNSAQNQLDNNNGEIWQDGVPNENDSAPPAPVVKNPTPASAQPVVVNNLPAAAPAQKNLEPELKQDEHALPKIPAGTEAWVVQVASFGTAQGAAELENKLRGAGFTVFVEPAEVHGKKYYRVRVGPHANKIDAEHAAANLRKQHKLNILIQRYP